MTRLLLIAIGAILLACVGYALGAAVTGNILGSIAGAILGFAVGWWLVGAFVSRLGSAPRNRVR